MMGGVPLGMPPQSVKEVFSIRIRSIADRLSLPPSQKPEGNHVWRLTPESNFGFQIYHLIRLKTLWKI